MRKCWEGKEKEEKKWRRWERCLTIASNKRALLCFDSTLGSLPHDPSILAHLPPHFITKLQKHWITVIQKLMTTLVLCRAPSILVRAHCNLKSVSFCTCPVTVSNVTYFLRRRSKNASRKYEELQVSRGRNAQQYHIAWQGACDEHVLRCRIVARWVRVFYLCGSRLDAHSNCRRPRCVFEDTTGYEITVDKCLTVTRDWYYTVHNPP
jgi:hypothetical protein